MHNTREIWSSAESSVQANFFEFVIEEFIRTYCKPGVEALDVGANFGAHTQTMLACGATVHAFEPNPNLAEKLEAWPQKSLTVHRVALSDKTGSADLMIAKEAGSGSLRFRPHQEMTVIGKITVPVRRLDDFELMPALIKVDVEGEEIDFLRGAWETLERARPIVLLEIDWRETGADAEWLGELKRIGYGLFDFFGDRLRIGDWNAWNILLYPEPELPSQLGKIMRDAGRRYFRDHRGWNPYLKLAP